jgi:hypothetical protein
MIINSDNDDDVAFPFVWLKLDAFSAHNSRLMGF